MLQRSHCTLHKWKEREEDPCCIKVSSSFVLAESTQSLFQPNSLVASRLQVDQEERERAVYLKQSSLASVTVASLHPLILCAESFY